MNSEIIQLRGIVKSFPGVIANNGVDLSVRAGTIHAIIGENGAGKSTLMKILYGNQVPDSGKILFEGKEVSFQWVMILDSGLHEDHVIHCLQLRLTVITHKHI